MVAAKRVFAPAPARAMADDTLTALDLRVLMALAAHDRFGANGIGCYASHPRLARLVNCHLKSLSRSLRVLAEKGYIDAAPHPLNKRLRVYRVLYTDADIASMKGTIGNEPVPDDGPTGNRDFHEAEQCQRDAEVNIFSEAERYPAEAGKHNSAESASPCGDGLLRMDGGKDGLPDSHGQELGRIQSRLQAVGCGHPSPTNIEALQRDRESCETIADICDDRSISGWADRLATDIDCLLEGME